MAENTQVAKQSFQTVLSEKLESIQEALPKDFNKARFVQNAIALYTENENLKKCDPKQVLSGLVKASVLGLDAYNSECYLIPYGKSVNFQLDYRGAVKLAKKYSIRPIKDIYAKIVREGDEFDEGVEKGEPVLNFKPLPFNDGKIIGAFAVALFKDGGQLYDSMSVADLENTRKSSKAANSPAWKNFTAEMYKKTVLHRLCKHIELEFENPSQRFEFNDDMAIETDVKQQVANDIEENANKTEFVPEADFIDVEVKEVVDEHKEFSEDNEPPFM